MQLRQQGPLVDVRNRGVRVVGAQDSRVQASPSANGVAVREQSGGHTHGGEEHDAADPLAQQYNLEHLDHLRLAGAAHAEKQMQRWPKLLT